MIKDRLQTAEHVVLRDAVDAPTVQIEFRQQDGANINQQVQMSEHTENYVVQVGFLNVKGGRPLRHHLAFRDTKDFLLSTEMIVRKKKGFAGRVRVVFGELELYNEPRATPLTLPPLPHILPLLPNIPFIASAQYAEPPTKKRRF